MKFLLTATEGKNKASGFFKFKEDAKKELKEKTQKRKINKIGLSMKKHSKFLVHLNEEKEKLQKKIKIQEDKIIPEEKH